MLSNITWYIWTEHGRFLPGADSLFITHPVSTSSRPTSRARSQFGESPLTLEKRPSSAPTSTKSARKYILDALPHTSRGGNLPTESRLRCPPRVSPRSASTESFPPDVSSPLSRNDGALLCFFVLGCISVLRSGALNHTLQTPDFNLTYIPPFPTLSSSPPTLSIYIPPHRAN